MALIVEHPQHRRLAPEALEPWRAIPTTIASDETNRAGGLDAGIKPVGDGMRIAGQAVTVEVMAGDNAAIQHALATAPAGSVLVVDAGGLMRNAVWGGITHRYAELRRLGGVVIDGCVRDVAEIRASSLAVFARGAVPNGPHKGFGGAINRPIQCGGRPVRPGDLVLGDDDGVVVVPLEQAEEVLARCQAKLQREARLLERLSAGESILEIFDVPPADRIGR